MSFVKNKNEPSHEKINSVDSALSIDPDQPKNAAQANPDRHISVPVDCLFQESLRYTSIPLIRNMSVLNVGFLVERLNYVKTDVLRLRRQN